MSFKFCLLGIFLTINALANNGVDYFENQFIKANEAYKLGKYDTARTLYQEIENNEIHSAELFYNIANCYFKENENAAAILYYERALRLSPADEDVMHNL